MGMDTQTGAIRKLTADEPLKPTEVAITRREAKALKLLPPAERSAKLGHIRGRAKARREAARQRARTGKG